MEKKFYKSIEVTFLEERDFDYNGGMEYAKKGWEYYFSKGMNLPEVSK